LLAFGHLDLPGFDGALEIETWKLNAGSTNVVITNVRPVLAGEARPDHIWT
jgi:hypothetical protein